MNEDRVSARKSINADLAERQPRVIELEARTLRDQVKAYTIGRRVKQRHYYVTYEEVVE